MKKSTRKVKHYTIIKGLELPPHKEPVDRSKYPFGQMEIGEAMLWGKEDEDGYQMQKAYSNANSSRVRKKLGWKFAARRIKGDVYVWRVA